MDRTIEVCVPPYLTNIWTSGESLEKSFTPVVWYNMELWGEDRSPVRPSVTIRIDDPFFLHPEQTTTAATKQQQQQNSSRIESNRIESLLVLFGTSLVA